MNRRAALLVVSAKANTLTGLWLGLARGMADDRGRERARSCRRHDVRMRWNHARTWEIGASHASGREKRTSRFRLVYGHGTLMLSTTAAANGPAQFGVRKHQWDCRCKRQYIEQQDRGEATHRHLCYRFPEFSGNNSASAVSKTFVSSKPITFLRTIPWRSARIVVGMPSTPYRLTSIPLMRSG
jgi:hypothetical protein